jgi:predicted TIM-barrel fold metal-dependent hydrolase
VTDAGADIGADVGDPGLVDHHCHGVVMRDLDRLEFESLLNEATRPSPLGTSLFDSMAGLAVRRWCAPVLDLEPLATADDYLTRRRELGFSEVARRFLQATHTEDFLVDTGYAPGASGPEELARLAGARSHEIVRLESLAQDLLSSGAAADAVPERVLQALHETTAVGAKSIAAYRTGLALDDTKPAIDDVVKALRDCERGADGSYRIADPPVQAWLAWSAVECGLPLQFHVGYGDNDVNLHDCDPLLLTGFLRSTQDRGVPVLLLHNYPFHRHASYLAQVFEHVFMDVGLATHNTGVLSAGIIRESLELVPFAKLLYSSDAFGLPELYHLAALLFRRGLARLLDELVDAGEASAADAERLTVLVTSQNARRVYRLEGTAQLSGARTH